MAINFHMHWMMKEFEVGILKEGVRLTEGEWRVAFLFYTNDLILCDEIEESLLGSIKCKALADLNSS